MEVAKLNNVLLLAGQLEEKRQLKDGVVKFAVVCNEMPPDKLAELFALKNSFVYIAVKPENFLAKELDDLHELQAIDTPGKTPSKRVRDHIYRLWEAKEKPHDNFELYYIDYCDKICQHIRKRIDQTKENVY